MLRLLKYELRGKLVFLGGTGIILAMLNLFIFLDCNVFRAYKYEEGINLAFSMMLGFAAMIVVIVGAITRLEKDLYSETGYLTFTLPKSGYSILGAKLLASFIEIVEFSILNVIFFALQIVPHVHISKSDISLMFKLLAENYRFILFTLFMMILFLIIFILMVYFSLVSVRSFSKRRKLGKAASFCVFIGLSILIGFTIGLLEKAFPQIIKLNFNNFNTHIVTQNIQIDTIGEVSLNIAASIFSLILPFILFISTSFLIEKRIDI